MSEFGRPSDPDTATDEPADRAARLRELAAATADPVERDALLDTAAEVEGLSLTGDGHARTGYVARPR